MDVFRYNCIIKKLFSCSIGLTQSEASGQKKDKEIKTKIGMNGVFG